MSEPLGRSHLPQEAMLSGLIDTLQKVPSIYLSQTRADALWERYLTGNAHFVVADERIVGSCVVWEDALTLVGRQHFGELGSLWVDPAYRHRGVIEIAQAIPRILQGRRALAYFSRLATAQYAVKSRLYPAATIANAHGCPTEVIAACACAGWHPEDLRLQTPYTRVLYPETDGQMSPWYLVYAL